MLDSNIDLNFQNYKFNLLPSIQSDKHFLFDKVENLPNTYKKYAAPQQKIPPQIDYRPLLNSCRDQGSENSCVSFSACGAKEYQEKINCKYNDYFSPQFIYNNRKDSSQDNGMSIQELTDILLNIGVCSENDCLYGKINNKSNISQNAYKNAKNFRIKGYAQVNSLDGLKLALIQNGPCLIGVNVYNYTNELWKPKPGDNNQGGHCMLCVSFNDQKKHLGIRNSWGCSNWGDQGYTYMSYDDFKYISEIWTIIDDPTSVNVYIPSKENPQLFPSPTPQIAPTPVQQQSNNISLVTAIQEMKCIDKQQIHRVWIRIINNSGKDLKNIKLSIECDKVSNLFKLDKLNFDKLVQTPNNVILKNNKDYICGVECIYNNKKPIIKIIT